MMNCKSATQLLSQKLDRDLSLAEKAGLKLHTSMCSGCRNVGEQMQALQSLSKNFVKQQPPGNPPQQD